MVEGQKSSASEKVKDKLIRPVLIASDYTVSEYLLSLGHLLLGLADESVPTALVCPTGRDVDSVVPPSVEVIRYPTFKLPLMGRKNRKILAEQLESFESGVFVDAAFKDSREAGDGVIEIEPIAHPLESLKVVEEEREVLGPEDEACDVFGT